MSVDNQRTSELYHAKTVLSFSYQKKVLKMIVTWPTQHDIAKNDH